MKTIRLTPLDTAPEQRRIMSNLDYCREVLRNADHYRTLWRIDPDSGYRRQWRGEYRHHDPRWHDLDAILRAA